MDKYGTAEVWYKGEFLGRVAIWDDDWRVGTNWRDSALAAARRVYGWLYGRYGYHVVEASHVMGERI